MWGMWIPTKKEIEKSIDQNLQMLAAQENWNPCWSKERWLRRYLYTQEHEIFFASFPNELHEWLSKLVNNEPTWKHDDPIVWTPELIKHLEETDYKVASVVYYWMDSMLGFLSLKFQLTHLYLIAKLNTDSLRVQEVST